MKTLKPIWLTRGIIIDKVNTLGYHAKGQRKASELPQQDKKGEKAIPLTTYRGGSVLAEI